MRKIFIFFAAVFSVHTYGVTYESIKYRQIGQYELTQIIMDLAAKDALGNLEKWQTLSPDSFRKLDFTKAYLAAGNKSLNKHLTNQALAFYIKSYQSLGSHKKNDKDKITAAYRAAFLLYSQQKRNEALFYINRAIEGAIKVKLNPLDSLAVEINNLKRRIIWRYLSRLDSLPDNAISTIKFDEDDVWIGMWSGGVARFSRSSMQMDIFNAHNSDLRSMYVRDILVQPDKIWVATHCGLSYYQKSTSTWRSIPEFNNLKLKKIKYDKGYLYVASLFRGVFRSRNGVEWENIVPKKNVLDMVNLDNALYIATAESGVFVYRQGLLQSFLPDISVKVIIPDTSLKYLWIGTYGQGLLKVDKNTGRIVQRFDSKYLGSDYVESLLMVDGKLWIGTLESGIKIYNVKKKRWESLGLKQGLPGLDIMTITRENEFLWFGTLAGGIGIYLFQEKIPVKE
ncbi:MAG: hypothetical protein ACRCTQ_02295 [Brevinemataceae bacterium]